jgi:hypothetical protein
MRSSEASSHRKRPTLRRHWALFTRVNDAAADRAAELLDEAQRAVLARASAAYLGEAGTAGDDLRPDLRAHAPVSSLGTMRRSAPVLEAASRTQTRIGTAPAANEAAASPDLMN